MRGRKSVPTTLKVLRGNPGKRPLNTGEPQYEPLSVVAPPELLHEKWSTAKAEWDRIAPDLLSVGLLRRVDRSALMAYCIAYQNWFTSQESIRDRGAFVRSQSGWVTINPHFRTASKAFEEMRMLMSEFGLTPSTRVRLKADIPTGGADPFLEYLKGGKG